MANLETYQAYADKCAEKLGIKEKPVLRWAGGQYGCSLGKRIHAHCHLAEFVGPRNRFARGTICLSHSYFAVFSVKEWRHCLAHEVTHLAVKSAHCTPTFDRRLVALGVANDSERINARSARRGHHHIWRRWLELDGTHSLECRVCHKKQKA